MWKASNKVSVTVIRIPHAGSPDTNVFEIAVPVRNNGTDMLRFGMCFQHMLYLFDADTIQFAVFKGLDIILAFLLTEQAFKQYDYIIFFHKPGGYFPVINVIITSYQPLLQVPCIAAYFAFKNKEFILFLPGKAAGIPQRGFH